MNKNAELLPYYIELAKRIKFQNVLPFWAIAKSKRIKVGQLAGVISRDGYRVIRITLNKVPKTLSAHRLQWIAQYGELPRGELDHINHNSIGNLRQANRSQNMSHREMLSNNTSGFKGVSMDKRRGLWRSSISVPSVSGVGRGRNKFLGYFKDKIDAARAYDRAVLLYGLTEFTILNFPGE